MPHGGNKYVASIPSKNAERDARQEAIFDVLAASPVAMTRIDVYDRLKRQYTRHEVSMGIEMLKRYGRAVFVARVDGECSYKAAV